MIQVFIDQGEEDGDGPPQAQLVAGTVNDPPLDRLDFSLIVLNNMFYVAINQKISSMADIKTFCRKLEKMCLKKGVELITNTAITKIVTQDGSVSGVEAIQRYKKLIWIEIDLN